MGKQRKAADQIWLEKNATATGALFSNPPFSLRQKDDLPLVKHKNNILNTYKVEKQ